MNQDMHIIQGYQQRQQLAPCVVHGIQLLSMPYTALIPFLQKIVLENPLLELNPDTERTPLEMGLSEGERHYSNSGKFDGQIPDSNWLEREEELLRLELMIHEYPKQVEQVALVILHELDEHGYWRGNLEELANRFGIKEETAASALTAVQSLKPEGIGARSLTECLLLQVDEKLKNAEIIRSLIQDDMSLIAGNRIRQIQKKYGISSGQAKEILNYIRSLNPYPVELKGNEEKNLYVCPEMSVHYREGKLKAVLTCRSEQLLSVNDAYLKRLEEDLLDPEAKQFIRNCQNTASELMGSLKLRDHTMQRVLEEIVRLQSAYFTGGASYLRPMTLKQIAEKLQVSTSTVCRCVQDKYMETDFGVIPLKSLFSARIQTCDGNTMSSVAVKTMIHAILEKEGEKKYSDRQLAEMLAEQGVHISRRTVTKYRNEERLCNRSERR